MATVVSYIRCAAPRLFWRSSYFCRCVRFASTAFLLMCSRTFASSAVTRNSIAFCFSAASASLEPMPRSTSILRKTVVNGRSLTEKYLVQMPDFASSLYDSFGSQAICAIAATPFTSLIAARPACALSGQARPVLRSSEGSSLLPGGRLR